MTAPLRAALYNRVSLDQTGEGLAVARYEEDGRKLAKQRRWKIVETFNDNSISAAGKKHRPGFAAMLVSINRGEIDAVVAWSLDRLARNARDRLALVEACRDHGTIIALVQGSDMDPTTASGRMVIGVLGEVAQMEIDLKSERQRRAAKQRADLGRPPLGVRLTGYTVKGQTVPDEAELVRRIFKLFHAGESLRTITRTLADEGVKTRHGRPWNPSSIRSILVNPRYAGRAIYQGNETGKAGAWEPLVSEDIFDVVQARLNDPRRITNREGTDRKHLGSGLYRCAECDKPCTSWSGGRYRCRSGHVNRSQQPVDEWVRTVVARQLKQDKPIAKAMQTMQGANTAPLLADLKQLRDRQAKIDADYDAGLIDGYRYASASERVRAELEVVEQKMAVTATDSALAQTLMAADPAQAFLDAGLMTQRSIINAMCTVRLHRGVRYSKSFDPETIKFEWHR